MTYNLTIESIQYKETNKHHWHLYVLYLNIPHVILNNVAKYRITYTSLIGGLLSKYWYGFKNQYSISNNFVIHGTDCLLFTVIV